MQIFMQLLKKVFVCLHFFVFVFTNYKVSDRLSLSLFLKEYLMAPIIFEVAECFMNNGCFVL